VGGGGDQYQLAVKKKKSHGKFLLAQAFINVFCVRRSEGVGD